MNVLVLVLRNHKGLEYFNSLSQNKEGVLTLPFIFKYSFDCQQWTK